uniref:Uncharacterized protein n=1 Tax=Sphaerodactylus townsendi TaxID=933632 RepID=A0ACB8EYT4_9SAUR
MAQAAKQLKKIKDIEAQALAEQKEKEESNRKRRNRSRDRKKKYAEMVPQAWQNEAPGSRPEVPFGTEEKATEPTQDHFPGQALLGGVGNDAGA